MMQEQHVVDKIKKSYPFVNLVFGTHNIFKYAELFYEMLQSERQIVDIWEGTDQIVEDLPTERNYTFNLIWYSYLKKFAIKEYSKSNATKQIKKEHSNSVMHIDSRVVLSLCVKYYEIEERLLRTIENYRTLIAYFRANNLIFDTLLGFIKKFKH